MTAPSSAARYNSPPEWLSLSPEVAAALEEGRAVVALESTVISHGLPYPDNLALARRLEARVREGGAVPATVALAGGQVRVGLDDELMARLATEPEVTKVSLRSLAPVLARGGLGATTVAGTMWAAAGAGIGVFSTGGIGGVHPGDGSDVSNDLPALATIPVCVVSSGAKAILDLPRTREWLETWGVPILGYRTDDFPAFYTIESGMAVDVRVDTVSEAAAIVTRHLSLGLGGLLFGVPIPADEAVGADEVQGWLDQALQEAEREGVRGYALTPFLLSRIGTVSGGRSLRANLALLENNARVAAALAVALAGG